MSPDEKTSFSGHPLPNKITTFRHGTNPVLLATKHNSTLVKSFCERELFLSDCVWGGGIWMYLCYKHTRMQIPKHMCMHGGQRRTLTIFIYHSALFPWLRIWHRIWIIWDQQISEILLPLTSPGLLRQTEATPIFFTWVLRSKLRSSGLHRKIHLSSPSLSFMRVPLGKHLKTFFDTKALY